MLNLDFHRYVFSQPYWGWLCRGVVMTGIITLLTSALSILLASLVVTCRLSLRASCRAAATVYVELFRNLPPLPLLLFLLFALPGTFRHLTGVTWPRGLEFPMLVLGLSLNTSTYLAETLRAGVNSVPREQWDAALVLGFKRRAVLWNVIYPQAVRTTLPALGTRLIHNMKNSTLALALPLSVDRMELAGQCGRIAGQTFAWAEPLVFAAIVYSLFSLSLTATLRRLTHRSASEARCL